ncbi:MAG: ceramidase domain-containing protein, partial [Pseudomonadota bacterium]
LYTSRTQGKGHTMNWTAQSDNYCERVDLTYWAEPFNAITNAAFIIAALIMLYRLRGTGLVGGYVLTAVLAAIGTGSYLFHTHATNWALLADVAPIGLFILTYLYLVYTRYLNWPWWAGVLGTVAFAPYAAAMLPVLNALPFFNISNFYWTVPVLLFAFAPFVARTNRQTARGMVIGALILCMSITLRSLDMLLCDVFPIGTHIFWHILNGVMLGWMIEVYRRHCLAPQAGAV